MPKLSPKTADKPSVVIVSAVHDYRMLRRGSIQAIASAFVRRGFDVRFVSIRFSLISLLKRDSRSFLWRRRNRPEQVDGVEAYLWFTPLHPFDVRWKALNWLLRPLFSIFARLRNSYFDATVRSASIVIIESGLGIVFAPRIKSINPSVRLIYRASDKLETIGAPLVLQAKLEQSLNLFDSYCLLAAKMASDFAWADGKVFNVPLGINAVDYSEIGPSPYSAPLNAVSVGSMLFDETFFGLAANRFPSVMFHVIGCGTEFTAPSNVRIYAEMKFKQTLPYIRHANFGVAPYVAQSNSGYLSESSLKLIQYEYLGIPAVCPQFAVKPGSRRYGYEPGDADSIAAAVEAAIADGAPSAPPHMLSWEDVAARLLKPSDFADCELYRTVEDAGALNDPIRNPVMSLVVCTRGRTIELERLFSSLTLQALTNFEVILVDQNPPGFLDHIVNKYSDVLQIDHTQSQAGLSKGRNIGIARARGRLIGFPDDDCWYPPDTMQRVEKFFGRYPDIAILLGRTVDAEGVDSLSPARPINGNVSRKNIWISGNSNTMFFRRPEIVRIGPFDEDLGVGAATPFQSGEETDFLLRALDLGLRAVYMREIVIHHDQVARGGEKKDIRRASGYSMGFGRVLRKQRFGVFYVGYRVTRSFARALASLVFEDEYGPRYRFAWALGTLSGYLRER